MSEKVYEDVKSRAQEVFASVEGLPVADAMAKLRVDLLNIVEETAKEHGVFDQIKGISPGAFFTVSQAASDPSKIQVLFGDRLKEL